MKAGRGPASPSTISRLTLRFQFGLRPRETGRNMALTPAIGLLEGGPRRHVAKLETGLINLTLVTMVTIARAIDADLTDPLLCSEPM